MIRPSYFRSLPAQHTLNAHRFAIVAASSVFCVVSMGANVSYGMMLGTSPGEKAVYAAASIAADILKIAVPALALTHWYDRKGGLAALALLLWLGAMVWSTSSALGFALSTRETTTAIHKAEADTRLGWVTTIERAESNLAALGRVRPSAVIKAELAAVNIDPAILRRTRHCSELPHENLRQVCAPVLRLKTELATAEASEKYQAEAATNRAQLATTPVVGSQSDPPARAVARLVGADEGAVRVGFALLLAGLIEAGSALGLTVVSVSGRANPPQPLSSAGSGPTKRMRRRSRRTVVSLTAAGLVERWVEGKRCAVPTLTVQAGILG